MIILFQDRLKYKYISDILLRSLFINYIVENVLLFCYYSLLLASQLPSWQLLSCSLLFLAGRFLLFSRTVVYVYFQITFGKFDSRICGNVYQSKEGPANHHQKKHVEKSRHSKRRLPYPPNSYNSQITRISDKWFRKKFRNKAVIQPT